MEEKKNVVLTGFMGTGKTTIGRILARALDYEFVDTDEMIEARSGTTIATIFAEQGEGAFRQMEHELALELAATSGQVIATGGGLLVNPANAAALGTTGHIFCLVATPETILRRALAQAHDSNEQVKRPLLDVADPQQRIIDLLAARQAHYAQFPQIETTSKKPSQIMQAILDRLERLL